MEQNDHADNADTFKRPNQDKIQVEQKNAERLDEDIPVDETYS